MTGSERLPSYPRSHSKVTVPHAKAASSFPGLFDHATGSTSPRLVMQTLGVPRRPWHRVGRKTGVRLPGQRVPPSSPKFATLRAEHRRPRPPVPAATVQGPCPDATGCPGLEGGGAVGENREGRMKVGEQDRIQEREETAPPFVWHPCQSCYLTEGMSQGWNAQQEPWNSLGSTVHLNR